MRPARSPVGGLSDDTPPAGPRSQAASLADQVGVAGARLALESVSVAVDLARLMVLTATPAELASGDLERRLLHLLPDAGWQDELAAIEARERRVDAMGHAYHQRHHLPAWPVLPLRPLLKEPADAA